MRWAVPILLAVTHVAPASPADDQFESKVRPLLVDKCGACHIAQSMSGLRVDSREALIKGGSRGPAIEPGQPQRSLLMTAIRHSDAKLKMPPAGRLTAAEEEAIEHWIASGAPWPSARAALPAAKGSPASFWSFQQLPKPAGSIDGHVRRELAAKGLKANPPTDRRTLLRRLTYDLTGLPPTAAQAERFLHDQQTVAQLVDELLASPRFGERWGRHWLDVARYGEDDFSGTEPKPYPNAWRYRDWVISAFNRNLPYDEFVRAQLAADVVPTLKDELAALGLFGLGPWYYGISQPPQARADERHDRVDMVTRGLLGLTAACARCHDHKYDPVPQSDYYALAGVFASTAYKEYPLVDAATAVAYDDSQKQVKKIEKEIAAFLDTQREQLAAIYARQSAAFLLEQPGLDALVAQRWKDYLGKTEDDHPFLKTWRDSSTPQQKEAAAQEFQRVLLAVMDQKRDIDEENRQAVIRATKPDQKRRKEILPGNYDSEADFNPGADVPTKSLDREHFQLWQKFLGTKDAVYRLDDTAVEQRLNGEFRRHLEALRKDLEETRKQAPQPYPYLHGIAEHAEPIDLPLDVRGNPWQAGEVVPRHFLTCLTTGATVALNQGSGRLQLAEVIVRHPLAARVMANRIWAWLTGAGIVRTPSNFGVMGDRPSNPALLDYLASRFVEDRFDMKRLIREIVLSETYQASSASVKASAEIDPDNRLFWRANRKRLDAEAIRDAMLASSGELRLDAGGESSPLDDSNLRRTVYARVGRYQQNETLALFDFPSASIHAEQRTATNVPLQKLFFLNSAFVTQRAEALAKRSGSVDSAYQILFIRTPSTEERTAGEDLVRKQGWPKYTQVLLAANEFLYVD